MKAGLFRGVVFSITAIVLVLLFVFVGCGSSSTPVIPTKENIREWGIEELAAIEPDSADIGTWKAWLTDYQFNDHYPDDGYAWLSCILALEAVNEGNFGIGCLLVDTNGDVVTWGHNEVYTPYFRSDRHAAMVVMDEFEDTHRDITKMQGYTLYTSLESCPMCLARLITSGVNTVLYVAGDSTGGMVHKMEDLPSVWIELAQRQVFGQVNCSPSLIDAANRIFLLNVDELNEKLKNR